MACIGIGTPDAPTLPDPLTLGVTTPPFDFDPALCCKLLPFPIAVPPIPLGIALSAPIVATINGIIEDYNAYHASLPFECPFE